MADYQRLTIMLCLPRSRSAWMAEFMRPYVTESMHNPLQQCASIEELGQKVDAVQGTVFISDVAGLFFFDKLIERFPGAKYLFVHRPSREVAASMEKMGIAPPLDLRKAERQLLEIASSIKHNPWVMAGTFFELHNPALLSAIVRFASGQFVAPRHLHTMMNRNVQVPIADQIARTDMQKQRVLFGQAKIVH